jgi:hypothetical protein
MINERGSRGKSYVREKHGGFILKHDYMTIIIDSIVEYFRYNNHEEYDSLIQTIKDQAYSFLKSANSRTYGDGEC